jgi:hypothetical protein
MYIAALIHPGFASLVAARPSQSTQGCAPRPVARKIDAQKGEEMVKISVRHYKNNVIFVVDSNFFLYIFLCKVIAYKISN